MRCRSMIACVKEASGSRTYTEGLLSLPLPVGLSLLGVYNLGVMLDPKPTVEEVNSTNGKRTLDYARPKPTAEKPRSIREWVSSGLLIGLVVTPPALFLAVLSAGAGHGAIVRGGSAPGGDSQGD
jgi:hypothetical protein